MRWTIAALAMWTSSCAPTSDIDDGTIVDTDVVTETDTAAQPPAEPGPLVAGFARRRIPAPVGIGVSGNGPQGGSANPSPFSKIYPGTKRIHGHPEMKAVALSRGPGFEVVFLRIDAIGMFSQLRNDIVSRASARVGRDLDDVVVIGATHTHSGPGRVVNTGTSDTTFFDIIADAFDPEFYDRFVTAASDAVVEALETAAPAEVAFGEATEGTGRDDRRCEDGEEYVNPRVPMVVVRQEGAVTGVVVGYSVHGTTMGLSDLHLSQDVHGAIEEAIEDRFDHPVEAVVLNTWGGDQSPGSPGGVPQQDTVDLGTFMGKYLKMREIGWVVAEAVDAALPALAYEAEPTIDLETRRFRIDREVIGYDDDTFENFEFGGVYCTADKECGDPTIFRDRGPGTFDLDDVCVPFPESFPAPMQTATTVGRLGSFLFVTYPGESGTRLAESLMTQAQERVGSTDPVFFVGYSQDYLGYGLLEEDWWNGGYEASGAIWGPLEGEYLRDRIVDKLGVWAGVTEAGEEPEKLEPFPYTIEPYVPETALAPNTVKDDVTSPLTATDAVVFTVRGHDPWLGAPLARIVHADGTPALRPGGQPIDSDTYAFDVELTVDPPYAKVDGAIVRADRSFAWRFRAPVQAPVPGVASLAPGTYRVDVDVPQPDGTTTVVSSATFEVTAP